MVVLDIWVEGIADQKFLADILSTWFSLDFNREFECRDEVRKIEVKIRQSGNVNTFTSNNEWAKNKESIFRDNNSKGVKNIIILDADENFDNRRREVSLTVNTPGFSVETDLFLWPDNLPRNGKGDLERLLVQIINPENKIFFQCWQAYEDCLVNKINPYNPNGNSFFLPDRKAMIYAYLEAYIGDTDQAKESGRDYKNENFWKLEAEVEPLLSLSNFLRLHLKI